VSETNCVIGSKPHAADVGYLCRHHLEELGRILRDVEDEAVHLSAVPSMQQSSGSRGGTLASHRAPARLDVVVANDHRRGTGIPLSGEPDPWGMDDTPSVLNTLHSWARVVREDRVLSVPASITVTGERDLLSRQLDWISEQLWVDELVDELRKLLMALRRINGTNALRKKSVGVCPTLLEDGECGGRLWPNDERGDVTCELCGRLFEPSELRLLGKMLIQQGYVELFRAEWFTGVPAGTIRRWVSEGRCTSEKDGRKLMVQVTEIARLRDRRKTRRVAS
jgi:hypothetical protein